MQKSCAQPPGGEDPLEEGRETHSSIPARRIPRTDEPGKLQKMVKDRKPGVLQSTESQGVRHDGATKHTPGIRVQKLYQLTTMTFPDS